MKTRVLNRRSFLAAGSPVAAFALTPSSLFAATAADKPESLVAAFDDAWARHDAHALALLHADDSIVVNRYGSMLEGRAELEKALHYLHDAGGPFHAVTFPRQQVLTTRVLRPGVAAIHTKWSNPQMGAGDQLKGGAAAPWVDMIATYLLVHGPDGWLIAQHDLHNVDPIQFPFATKWNH